MLYSPLRPIRLHDSKWIYRGDDWLLVRRWEHLLAYRNAIDIVQVISWNGELFLLVPQEADIHQRRWIRLW